MLGQEDPVSFTVIMYSKTKKRSVVKDGESKDKIEKP
jgi:hypothetical protein